MLPVGVFAQGKGAYYASGMVRDAETMEPLPFASVTVVGKATGALTNDQGIFELTVPDNAKELQVTCLGYEKAIIPIRKNQVNLYDIQMRPTATQLTEVVVHKQKYSKKNNPAVDFVNRLKECGPKTDPRRNDYYNYDKYQIITLALNDFMTKDEASAMFRKFPFLWDHVDTSEVSGKPILNILVKEKSSDVHYRREPHAEKEIIRGTRQEGVDQILDQRSMRVFLEDMLREIDLYDNDINLLQNRFVSPLSRIAPDFYKFYLTDTVEVAGEKCIVLSFYPHNQAMFGFNGQVFVPVNDESMFIKKVVMRTPRNINLNFIDNLYISQEFDRAPDGSRLKRNDDITLEMKIMPGTPSFYMRRNVAYANHDFLPSEDMSVYGYMQNEIETDSCKERSEEFWDAARLLTVTENEKNVDSMLDGMRRNKVFYYGEQVLKVIFAGYINTGRDSKFDIGPVNTTVSHNSLEGWRFRFGGITTANLNKRWFTRFYGAYGLKDHKWKYGTEVEYSFRDKEYHSREFPVHSLRLTSLYDIDQLGEHYLYTNNDNFYMSLKRLPDEMVTYHWVNKLDYTLELHNNFSVAASLKFERQEASRFVPFIDGHGNIIPHYDETSLSVTLRYAPGEKYLQSMTHRIPISLDAPMVQLTHTIAPKGLFGSRFMINSTELSFGKRFWFSTFGFTDIIVKGGHVWSRAPFTNLLIPNANLSYIIQAESYAMMNAMEFVNDSYIGWDLTYWANGAILNYVPLVKKLKLREVFTFRGLWGELSHKNDPQYNPELFVFPTTQVTRMTKTPYMEAAVGLDNVFKCLRVDYVWRLSYLDVPYKIDRRGLRLTLHLAF